MPWGRTRASNDLSIELARPNATFHPGDVVEGHVIRKTPGVVPMALLRVRMLGRAWSELWIEDERAEARLRAFRGEPELPNQCRSLFNFWPPDRLGSQLVQGPVHVPRGEPRRWAFSFTLPLHTNRDAVNEGLSPEHRRASLVHSADDPDGERGVPATGLPDAFLCHEFPYVAWCTLVEYYLEAEMTVEGKKTVYRAARHIQVRSAPSATPPISDFRLATRYMAGVVATHHLVPRRTDEKLSWEQRLQNLVRSPAVPRFSFELRVDFPKQLQLGNPSPVPFRLRLLPRDEGTSDMVRNSHQTVFVTKVTLEVHTTVGTACPGLLGLYDSWIKKRNLLGKVRRPASNRRGLVLPVGEHVEPLDIGASFGLRLGAARLIMNPALVTGDGCEQLPPTTTTYTHSIEHKLHWEVEISIASEAARWSGTQHIVVLPAAGGGDDGSEAGPPPCKNADVPLVYQTPDLGAGRKGLGRVERMKPRGGVVTVFRAWPGQLSESYL
ncbi:hypothetical protein Cob_v001767 [Colletotrichum orbiculare MAFF 240422]|uniref:Arrestin-like N-terminal domain-containing protein n=1 Tax=Colletotrichum orbiculare (strain 104-T / ATCC 96160 / CBS 514.97 / LARS 414 / MAFF 240422) TaxID=1213857 RepID=N4UWD8_COLOR|nr:hypothetical protein Cob_v001767 [Colletotrichum orbiculare MAFF 240422]